MKGVILAAGMGTRLKPFINIPKALIQIKEKALIEYSLENLARAGITDVIIVTGFKESLIRKKIGNFYKRIKVEYVSNKEYSTTGSAYSLYKIKQIIKDDILLLESDLLYEFRALKLLLDSSEPNLLLVSSPTGSGDEVFVSVDKSNNLTYLGKEPNKKESSGEMVGISKLSFAFLKKLFNTIRKEFQKNNKLSYEEAIFKLSKTCPLKCLIIKDLVWRDIDRKTDFEKVKEVTFPKINEIKILEKKEKILKEKKRSWEALWEKKGYKSKKFDPIKLNGYDSPPGKLTPKLVKEIVKKIRFKLNLKITDKLLEVGCGAGMLLIPLSKFGCSVTGIDLSSALINKLRKVHPEFNLFVAEANDLPFERETFDKVLVFGVFHYFPSLTYGEKTIYELIRVCKKGGLILIMDIPDLSKKKENDEYRRRLDPKKAMDPYLQHLFYPKDFFTKICQKAKLNCEVWDQDIKGYGNSPFRFNVLIKK